MAGLRHNWEAFADCRLTKAQVDRVRSDWQAWLTMHASRLHPVDSPEALERAESNLRQWSRRKKPILKLESSPTVVSGEVLIAEIPRSTGRESQVNFHKEAYSEYFGVQEGAQARVLFRPVHSDGALGDVESRPSVARKSRNWSFELEAAAGLVYPSDGRPIGLYVRAEDQAYLYCILNPGDDGFASTVSVLDAENPMPGRMMRNLRVSLQELPHKVRQRFLNALPDAFVDEVVVE